MSYDFDFLAIGGGSGGIAAARRAARYGAKCAVVEADRLGGTCVNRGCVPKKIMWYAANIAHQSANASGYGFDLQVNDFSWETLVKSREEYIHRLNGIYETNLGRENTTILEGYGKLIDPHTVQVGDKQYTAERILLAPGGTPTVPAIPGAEHGITSDGFFELTRLPDRVAVIGAGYIAVELAGVLHALGAKVSLIVRKHTFLREFDELMSDLSLIHI